MFGEQMNHMNLEKEFKKLGIGLLQSLKSSLNIIKIFKQKSLKGLQVGFWYMMEPPKIHRLKAPGEWVEVQQRSEGSPHYHPPNLR